MSVDSGSPSWAGETTEWTTDGEGWTRLHQATFGDWGIVQSENLDEDGHGFSSGSSELWAAEISSSEQARSAAADLLRVADVFEQIERSFAPV